MEIGPPVLEKKIFEGVFTIYGHGGHLGHMTSILLTNFYFLVPESFHTKFVQNGTVVYEKIWFEFLYVHDFRVPTNFQVTGCNSV